MQKLKNLLRDIVALVKKFLKDLKVRLLK